MLDAINPHHISQATVINHTTMAKEKLDTEKRKAEAAAASDEKRAEVDDTEVAEEGNDNKTSEAKDEEGKDTPSPAADDDNGNDDGDGGEEPPADHLPNDGEGEEDQGGNESGAGDEAKDSSNDKPEADVEDASSKPAKEEAKQVDADQSKDASGDDGKGDKAKDAPEGASEDKESDKKSPDPPENGDDDSKTEEKVVVSKTTEKKSSSVDEPKNEQKESTLISAVDKKDDESNNPFAIGDDIEEEVEVKPTPDWTDEDKDQAPVIVSGDIEEDNHDDKKEEKKSKKSGFFFSKKNKKESSDWAKESGDIDEEKPAVVPTPAPVVHYDDEAPEAAVKLDGMGGVSIVGIHISEMRLPLVGMFLSAAVLLVAVLVYKGPGLQKESYRNYAISVPSATMCMSFLLMLITCKKDFYTAYGKIPNQITFLWNFIGACLLTFSGPFETTGNGYFAAWFTCIFSAAALGFSASTFKSTIRGMGAHMGLFCSSIIVIIAIVPWLGNDSFYRYEGIYTMCVAVVTLVMNLVLTFRQKTTEGRAARGCEGIVGFVVLSIFAIMWVVLAGLTTFRGPFLTTGNGYFSSWIGAACACFAAFASRRKSKAEALAKSKKNEDAKPDAEWAEEDDSPV